MFVGWLEVQERMVGMATLVPPVLKAPLGLVEVMETEDSGELRVPKVRRGKLVPRAHPATQAPMELL